MRSSKERKHDKKRKQDTMSVKKTERSRTRRLANKAKRAEIHNIDPDMKVIMIDQRIYDKHGTEIEIVNNKLHFITDRLVDILEDADPYVNDVKAEIVEVKPVIKVSTVKEVMEKEGMFSKLADRFRKK